MTKRQIARQLCNTEATIMLLRRQLKRALQKAMDLEDELCEPTSPTVRVVGELEELDKKGVA